MASDATPLMAMEAVLLEPGPRRDDGSDEPRGNSLGPAHVSSTVSSA